MMRKREAGTALMAALLFGTTLLALSASILISGVALRSEQRYLKAAQVAEETAESGVHRAVALLNAVPGNQSIPVGSYVDDLGGGRSVAVTITTGGTDGADNDLDGLIDDADEADLIEVACTGRHDQVSRTLRVTLRTVWNDPDLTSAVRLAEPDARIYAAGSSFRISGHDVDTILHPTGALYPGMAVEGSPAAVEAQYLAQIGSDRFEAGVLGDPRLKEETPLDIEEFVTAAIGAAEVLLHTYTPDRDGAVHPAYSNEWGTPEAPRIVYSNGDVKLGGSRKGAGLLIVDGDLVIEGGFEWVGLVLVRGGLRMGGGGSGIHLAGATYVYGTPDPPPPEVLDKMARGRLGDPDDAFGVDLYTAGTSDLVYSREAVEMVLQLARMSLVSRRTFTPMQWRRGEVTP